jgi:hypothetical protein
MPFIHIKSLPLKKHLEINTILEQLSQRFSRECDIPLQEVSASWEYFLPGQYAHAGITCPWQPDKSHPLLVELLTPDNYPEKTLRKMFECIANIISESIGVRYDNIFMYQNSVYSGRVFDGGKVVNW